MTENTGCKSGNGSNSASSGDRDPDYGHDCGPDCTRFDVTESQQERVKRLRRDILASLIAVKGSLDKPYPDDPRWTPWTRFIERTLRRVDEMAGIATDALHGRDLARLDAENERRHELDRQCRCGHRESAHRVGKTTDFGGYCCSYIGVGGAGFRSWCQCPGFEAYEKEARHG